MTKINTNVGALLSARQSSKMQSRMETSQLRLSSGLRINSAADDAAGLAVANKLKSQLRGFNSALKNTSDGLSLVQAAISGMKISLDISQRLRELSVQSHNGVYTNNDRLNLQEEAKALVSELKRVSENTKYNDILLLDGTYEQGMRLGNTNEEFVELTIDGMGVNKHIEGQSFATGDSATLLRPQAVSTGTSVFTTPETSLANGDMKAVYKQTDLAVGVSNFNTPLASTGSGLSQAAIRQVSVGSGNSNFLTPASSSAAGNSALQYLPTSNAIGTSNFRTQNETIATGSSTLTFVANSSGVAQNNGDTNLISSAGGISERVLKSQTLANGTSNLDYLNSNNISNNVSSTATGVVPSSIATVSSSSEITPLAFRNSKFAPVGSNFTAVNSETTRDIDGWEINLKQISLSSGPPSPLKRLIGGRAPPTDNTNPPNSAGDGNQITGFAGGNVELKYSTFDGGITLGTNDVNTSPYGVVHGPYIVSKDTVSLEVGDTFSFKWQAVGSGDAADVFAYLVDQGDGSIIQLLDYTHNSFGATPLQSVSRDNQPARRL